MGFASKISVLCVVAAATMACSNGSLQTTTGQGADAGTSGQAPASGASAGTAGTSSGTVGSLGAAGGGPGGSAAPSAGSGSRGSPDVPDGAASDADVASITDAGAAADVATDTSIDGGAAAPGETLPSLSDYSQPGPFPAKSMDGSGPDGGYTIFRPTSLDANGFKFVPLTWGNGIITTPSWYEKFLTTVASNGFVVVASDSSNVTSQMMTDGLNWLLAQNDQPGEYQGKLDTSRAVSMGYSIGGQAAIQTGSHPKVITTVSIHGLQTSVNVHGPLFLTTGTKDTIGLPLVQANFDASTVPTFMATLSGATHFEILGWQNDGPLGGQEGVPVVAWLRMEVFGDQAARKYFYGSNCTLCVSPWSAQTKDWQ